MTQTTFNNPGTVKLLGSPGKAGGLPKGNYLYADVATLSAPGGTGKTTLVLYELICIALGRPVHGLEVKKPGWSLLVTAEDSREQLTARLREIMQAMDLTETDRQTVLKSALIWDVSGEQMRLVRSENGNIVLTRLVDDIVRVYNQNPPVMVIFDPLISFGASEGQINDNEQGLITAARRIVRGLGCCVRLIAHTGKAVAREKTLDQYASRGGSALSDGARMVAVLQTWKPGDDLKPPAGCTPYDETSIAILARPKLSYAPPNLPYLWIRRTGHTFVTFTDIQISQEERDEEILDQVERFLASEVQQGHRHNKTSLETSIPNIKRSEARKAISQLMARGRIIEIDLPPKEQKNSRKTYLAVSADIGRHQKTDDEPLPVKPSGMTAAAYRENIGGRHSPPNFPPSLTAAAMGRQTSADMADIDQPNQE